MPLLLVLFALLAGAVLAPLLVRLPAGLRGPALAAIPAGVFLMRVDQVGAVHACSFHTVEFGDITDQQLIAPANLITMTPEVSEDQGQLLVHAMYVRDGACRLDRPSRARGEGAAERHAATQMTCRTWCRARGAPRPRL